MTAFDLNTFRRQAELFIGELDLEEYRHFAGLKEDCDFTSIYGRYPQLFTRETVATLTELYESTQGEAKKQLAFLLDFAVEGFIGDQTKEITDEIANLESELTIKVDGEEIGYRMSSVVQANEPNRARRRRIAEARTGVVSERLNPRYDVSWRLLHDIARELGHETYAALYSEIRAVDFGMLRATTDGFLHDTEGLYERALDALLGRTLGIGLDELHHADLPYLMRAPQYDHVFDKERLLPTLAQLLAGLGIDLASQPNVVVDAEPRERKSPRAFCAPVRVPDEIYLVVMPKGGQDDYGALLHEGGHAEHFAHTAASLPFEYRYLGDNSVTEGFAFLFDHLLMNPEFLSEYLGYADAADYLTFANVVELYFLRRYAGKLAYETELHVQTGSLDEMAARYAHLLGAAVEVDVPAQNYLVDVDPGFYAAWYLRAWMLEGAWRMLFQDRFGMQWFREPEAGIWLKDLWSRGQEFTADQLLLKNGGGRLDMGPLRVHLERALGR